MDLYSDIVIEHEGKIFVASTSMIDVTAMTEPDPGWTWTDDAGHTHQAVEGEWGSVTYPTLEVVNSAAKWCPSCEDVHPDVWFECRECRQRTLPGVRAGTRKVIPGRTSYYIDDSEVTPEQAKEFLDAWKAAGGDDADPHGMLIMSLPGLEDPHGN